MAANFCFPNAKLGVWYQVADGPQIQFVQMRQVMHLRHFISVRARGGDVLQFSKNVLGDRKPLAVAGSVFFPVPPLHESSRGFDTSKEDIV
jgi:hypothetical protein